MRMTKWRKEEYMAGETMKAYNMVALRDGLIVLVNCENTDILGFLERDCYKGEFVNVLIPEVGPEIIMRGI